MSNKGSAAIDIMNAQMHVHDDSSPGRTGEKSEEEPSGDALYTFDEAKLKEFRSKTPWMKDPKFFKKVKLSPSAIMKISMHCQSGVEKGVSKGGNPVEVMGLLVGRPLEETRDKKSGTLIVTDAFPLPIEGFETRVVVDDQDVVNHMIALTEYLEQTRKERMMGWYHSHPFEVGEHSHCFLSQTDLSTQLGWQRSEDPHGNPFLAIVVDPQRSTHLGIPQLKAFRAYPPEYTSPINNECPDGSINTDEHRRVELFGTCWNRYYELPIDYFMSKGSRDVLEKLTEATTWIANLQPDSDVTETLTKLGDDKSAIPNQKEWHKTCDDLGECAAAHAADVALSRIKGRIFP